MIRSDYSSIITLVFRTSFPHNPLSFSLDLIETFPLVVVSVLRFKGGQVENGAVHGDQNWALFNYKSPSPFMESDGINFFTLLLIFHRKHDAALLSVCALKLSRHIFRWV